MLPLLNRNPYPDFQGKWFLHDVFFPCGHFQSTFDEIHVAAAAAAKLLQSCPTLCDPRDGSPPGSPVPGILQARTLEWVAISFSNAWKWKVKEFAQSCPTLRDPMDCSLPGSSINGIAHARVLEWGAIAFFAQSWLSSQYASKAMKITSHTIFQNEYWTELKKKLETQI